MPKVTAPDGREWKVGRQWLPRRVRVRPDLDPFDFATFDDAGAGIVVGLALALALFVALLLLAPLLELLILLVLLAGGVIARVVFRRPWHVIARSGREERRWPVKGFRASGERVQEIAAALASGAEVAER